MAAARRHEMEERIRPVEGRGKIGDKEISEMSNSFVRRSRVAQLSRHSFEGALTYDVHNGGWEWIEEK